jgi:hypothetical protein
VVRIAAISLILVALLTGCGGGESARSVEARVLALWSAACSELRKRPLDIPAGQRKLREVEDLILAHRNVARFRRVARDVLGEKQVRASLRKLERESHIFVIPPNPAVRVAIGHGAIRRTLALGQEESRFRVKAVADAKAIGLRPCFESRPRLVIR